MLYYDESDMSDEQFDEIARKVNEKEAMETERKSTKNEKKRLVQ